MLPISLKKYLPSLIFLPFRKEAVREGGVYVRESDLLGQEAFREILRFERKRSERNNRTIAVLLLDTASIEDILVQARIIRHIARTAAAEPGARAGWYEQGKVIGITMNGGDGASPELLQAILGKITQPLPAAHVRTLKGTLRFFPGADGAADAGEGTRLFYEDERAGHNGLARSPILKRALDIVGSLAAIALFSPAFLCIAVLIKATSPGPVLFRQERVGRHGRTFRFLKFRSMAVNNDPAIHQRYIKEYIREQKSYDAGEAQQGPVFKIKDDPRVTSVGRFLRKSSLDELPQFFNVLRGDMSLVGPRPPIPYELENYDPWHRRRVMEIKPGITGLWQVSGRSRTTFDEMVRLDLRYAREWSLWLDIKIILRTPWAAIKGAY